MFIHVFIFFIHLFSSYRIFTVFFFSTCKLIFFLFRRSPKKFHEKFILKIENFFLLIFCLWRGVFTFFFTFQIDKEKLWNCVNYEEKQNKKVQFFATKLFENEKVFFLQTSFCEKKLFYKPCSSLKSLWLEKEKVYIPATFFLSFNRKKFSLKADRKFLFLQLVRKENCLRRSSKI